MLRSNFQYSKYLFSFCLVLHILSLSYLYYLLNYLNFSKIFVGIHCYYLKPLMSVDCGILDFGSGHDPRVVWLIPCHIGLQSTEFWILSLFLCPSPPLVLSKNKKKCKFSEFFMIDFFHHFLCHLLPVLIFLFFHFLLVLITFALFFSCLICFIVVSYPAFHLCLNQKIDLSESFWSLLHLSEINSSTNATSLHPE